MFLTDLQHYVNKSFIIFSALFAQSFHTTVPSAKMPFHSTTIFTLAHLLPLSLAHFPQKHHLNLLFSITKTLLARTLAPFWRKKSCFLCFIFCRTHHEIHHIDSVRCCSYCFRSVMSWSLFNSLRDFSQIVSCSNSIDTSSRWYKECLFRNDLTLCPLKLIYPSAAYMRQWIGSALVQIMAPIQRQAII